MSEMEEAEKKETGRVRCAVLRINEMEISVVPGAASFRLLGQDEKDGEEPEGESIACASCQTSTGETIITLESGEKWFFPHWVIGIFGPVADMTGWWSARSEKMIRENESSAEAEFRLVMERAECGKCKEDENENENEKANENEDGDKNEHEEEEREDE